MMPDCTAELERHVAAMERGNRKYLAALRGEEPAGIKLIWSGNCGAPVEGETIKRTTQTAQQHSAYKQFVESLRVKSGVCPRCGANIAKGCGHVS
jgi:hypothetical protein